MGGYPLAGTVGVKVGSGKRDPESLIPALEGIPVLWQHTFRQLVLAEEILRDIAAIESGKKSIPPRWPGSVLLARGFWVPLCGVVPVVDVITLRLWQPQPIQS
jgi:hypothetical protein